MSGHSEGDRKGKFCSLRKNKCPCGNDYRKPCEEEAAKWEAKGPGSSKYAQRYKDSARLRSHEAHHVACVASVTGTITVNQEIRPIVKNTEWCVNMPSNMIALPMWAHTISWYVDLEKEGLAFHQTDHRGKKIPTVAAPPFRNRAQHDYDHDVYIEEVNADLRKIVNAVKRAAAAHKDPTGPLASQLNQVIQKRRKQLKKASTHAAWTAGMNNPHGEWYVAFSMATEPTPRTFPVKGNDMARKVAEVRDAFLKLP